MQRTHNEALVATKAPVALLFILALSPAYRHAGHPLGNLLTCPLAPFGAPTAALLIGLRPQLVHVGTSEGGPWALVRQLLRGRPR